MVLFFYSVRDDFIPQPRMFFDRQQAVLTIPPKCLAISRVTKRAVSPRETARFIVRNGTYRKPKRHVSESGMPGLCL